MVAAAVERRITKLLCDASFTNWNHTPHMCFEHTINYAAKCADFAARYQRVLLPPGIHIPTTNRITGVCCMCVSTHMCACMRMRVHMCRANVYTHVYTYTYRHRQSLFQCQHSLSASTPSVPALLQCQHSFSASTPTPSVPALPLPQCQHSFSASTPSVLALRECWH